MPQQRVGPVAARAERDRWWLVAAVGLAVFMAMVDTTIVGIALPSIRADFAVPPAIAEWVVLGYQVPLVGLALPAGRWLDRAGSRPALLLSTGGFAAASVAAGLSPDIGWLIAARVAQGSFGAVLFALGPTLATLAVRPQVRGRAMGVVATVGPLGGVAGPALGGLLVDSIGWPWIFYINVPVGLVVMGIGAVQIPAGAGMRPPERALVAEALLLGAAAVALLLGFSLAASRGIGWLALTAAAVPAVLIWLRTEASRRVTSLLRTPGIARPHLALLAQTTAVGAVVFLTPFYLQDVLGRSATASSGAIMAFPVATMLLGPIGGMLADRWAPRRAALVGLGLLTVGLLATTPLGQGWSLPDLAWRLGLVGAGAGLFIGPNQTLAMSAAPQDLLATTGASTSLARQLGFSLGPALATTVWALSEYSPDGMRIALTASAALGIVAFASLTHFVGTD